MKQPIYGNLMHLHKDTGGVKCQDSHGEFFTVADAAAMALDYADALVKNREGNIDLFDKVHAYQKQFREWMPKPAKATP